MRYGFVKTVSFERGFGFIAQERGPDVYFHATVVADRAFDRIGPDQPVKFEIEPKREGEEPRGPRALLVQLLDKMPGGILQPAPTSTVKHHPKARQKKPTWRNKAVAGPEIEPPAAE